VKIDESELRSFFSMLCDHLVSTNKREVLLQHDFYWSVPKNELYDPYSVPSSLTLGQLDSDVAELRAMLDGSKPIVSYGFIWLAALLHAIGEEVVE